jgi:hypothetical protein
MLIAVLETWMFPAREGRAGRHIFFSYFKGMNQSKKIVAPRLGLMPTASSGARLPRKTCSESSGGGL